MPPGPSPDHEQRAAVTALRAQGLPITEIARRVNRSRQRVYAILKACGPVQRLSHAALWTPARDALLGTMSDRAVARRLGCDPGAVRRRRIQVGLPRQEPAMVGLSKLQEWVLRHAGRRPCLRYSAVLVGFFGWTPERPKPSRQPGSAARTHFDRQQIGTQKYKQTLVTVIRSCRLLCQRGLVERVARSRSTAGGVRLTSRGRQWLKANPSV